MSPAKQVAIIGLDCATPQFIFGDDAFDLPNLRRLMEQGAYGLLRSCDPPITVPAWSCMMSSKDPGSLGIYGFRNRRDHSYDALFTANASAIREPRLWDILSRAGKKVAVMGVPQTYPVRPVNGWLAAGFLAPGPAVTYTYPKAFKDELEQAVGRYVFDVDDFRTDDKEMLLRHLYEFLDNRFAAASYVARNKPWDFFMMVEMGLDRLHHGFWRFCDTTHRYYEPGNEFEHVFRDYYHALDARIGELLEALPDDADVFVVSDHGAKGMAGGVCVNQWLINEGLLSLAVPPSGVTRIEDCDVDWHRTKVWSTGGYYARVFINVEGREPQGVVPPSDYEAFRDELVEKLESMKDPEGVPLGTRALKPEDLYAEVQGVAPDLIVYFGDLNWRSVGTVGYSSIYTFENDTGPDDANHDYNGVFIMNDGARRQGHRLDDLSLLDVAPTVLDRMDLPIPEDMQGQVIP